MRVMIDKQLRLAVAIAVFAAAVMLAPTAMAGSDQGGSRDKVPDTAAYTNYSTTTDQTATPCLTCYAGAGLAGTQDKTPAAVPVTPRCDTCTKGS
ncbi:MAG TPA: hypothetical protein VH184_07640 [Dongiaceae bacterium]|nr:hypothetical protein [Dongiaceae bacterium]